MIPVDRRAAVVVMLSLAALGCGGKTPDHHTIPEDPFSEVPVGTLPVGTIGGTNVLLLTAGGVVVGDTTNRMPDLELRRTALLTTANALLDTALRRDGREVNWMGLEEQRRAARRNPTLNLDPDRFATAYLIGRQVEKVPDPLFGQLRSIAAVTNARFAVAPAGVRITGRPDSLVASYVLVVADARMGTIMLRIRATGRAATTPEAALASAAGTVIASPLSH